MVSCGHPSASPFSIGHAGDACDDRTLTCLPSTSCTDGTCTPIECPVEGCHDLGSLCGTPLSGGLTDNVYCELGSRCKKMNDLGRGTCTPYAADGETCGDDWAGPPCLFPARCVDYVCRLPEDLDCR